MGEIKKGIILSYALIILTNITGLFLTPYIIKNLGDSQYGLYSLLGALIAYLSIFDLGLNNTIVRYVSKYRAEKNKVVEENFLATIMYIYYFIIHNYFNWNIYIY
ncbi:MAG: oligosaccharide flippase family protein [Bacteroides sp.]|nr:oligosaccharide flippase family protein [Bacteroides sp.]